jgi:disulfide bond formation protein DsbB
MKYMSPGALIAKVLSGSGECSEVTWRFLGLAMPAWVLVCALILGAFGVTANALSPRVAANAPRRVPA